jgi:hypothetical protein
VFLFRCPLLICSSLGLLIVLPLDLYCSKFRNDVSFGFVLFWFRNDNSVGRIGYGRLVGFGSFLLWIWLVGSSLTYGWCFAMSWFVDEGMVIWIFVLFVSFVL